MSTDKDSVEYKKATAQAKQIVEVMRLCFSQMQVCMRMNSYLPTEDEATSPKITPAITAKILKDSSQRVQSTIDRFLDNDGSSQGFEILTEISKALSEEFLMDYFAEQKKNATPKPAS
jgi:hypothetical protein